MRYQAFGNKYGWKTGQTRSNGYVMVYSPEHPNRNAMGKGYVKRARLVMEKHIGRYLTRDEHVHHLNGIRDDDRIENLVIITRSQHMSEHHSEAVKKQRRDHYGRFKGGDANV